MMWELAAAVLGGGLLSTVVNAIVQRRGGNAVTARTEAETERIAAETEDVHLHRVRELLEMYRTELDRFKVELDEVRERLNRCEQEKVDLLVKISGLERELGGLKLALSAAGTAL